MHTYYTSLVDSSIICLHVEVSARERLGTCRSELSTILITMTMTI